jgi:hypothetical protein
MAPAITGGNQENHNKPWPGYQNFCQNLDHEPLEYKAEMVTTQLQYLILWCYVLNPKYVFVEQLVIYHKFSHIRISLLEMYHMFCLEISFKIVCFMKVNVAS